MISLVDHPEPGHIIGHSGPHIKSFFIDPEARTGVEHDPGGLYFALFSLSTVFRLGVI
jgi:hypothetical protein